jgi:hypothetical protein
MGGKPILSRLARFSLDLLRGDPKLRGGENVKKLAVFVTVAAIIGIFSGVAGAQQFTLMVDVGSTSSLGMSSGGMLSTGGGPITFNDQAIGTFMHTSQTMTMLGMMAMESFQQRMITLQLPGIGMVFGMMAGGAPWSGASGIIIGGTDGAHGVSGTVTVGAQVSPNRYPFVFNLGP